MNSADKLALSEVAYGIKLVRYALILTVLGAIVAFFLTVLLQNSGRASLPFMNAVALILAVLTAVMALLGQVYCLQVPAAARARVWIACAVVFGIGGLVLELSGVVPSLSLIRDFSGFAAVIRGAGFIAFLVFLRRVAVFVSAQVVAEGVGRLIAQALIVDLLTVVVTCLRIYALVGQRQTLLIISLFGLLLAGLLGLTLVFRYLAAMTEVQRAIDVALVEPPPDEAQLFGNLL